MACEEQSRLDLWWIRPNLLQMELEEMQIEFNLWQIELHLFQITLCLPQIEPDTGLTARQVLFLKAHAMRIRRQESRIEAW